MTCNCPIMPRSSCSRMWQWNMRMPSDCCTVLNRTFSPGRTLTVSRHARYGSSTLTPFDDLKLCAMQMKRVVHVGLIVDFPQLYLASAADKIHAAEVECLAIDEEFHATWAFICRRARLEHCPHLHTFGKRNLLYGLRFPKTCQRSQSGRQSARGTRHEVDVCKWQKRNCRQTPLRHRHLAPVVDIRG